MPINLVTSYGEICGERPRAVDRRYGAVGMGHDEGLEDPTQIATAIAQRCSDLNVAQGQAPNANVVIGPWRRALPLGVQATAAHDPA